MPYASLREFIDRLERDGRLVRVREPVSTVLEMTEIQTRLLAENGPAVLFEQPLKADGTRCDMPVLVNLFGTVKRVAWGMDRDAATSCARWARRSPSCASPSRPSGCAKRSSCCRWRRRVLSMKPKTVGSARRASRSC